VRRASWIVLLVCAPLAAPAARIDSLHLAHDGDRYRVAMSVHLDVPASRAYAAFADPLHLPEINPAVRTVRVVAGGAGASPPQLYTEVHLCVLFLCRTLHQLQRMSYQPSANGGRMSADVLPAQSDLRYGHAEWNFQGEGATTRLDFTLDVEPKFWVPPLLGPWAIERTLRSQAERTSAGIERLARRQ
jgi:hypothetical protein